MLSQDANIRNIYHLHAILIHSGSLNHGHYYAFIRPTMEDKWYRFNDSDVTESLQSTAFKTGIGSSYSKFRVRNPDAERAKQL